MNMARPTPIESYEDALRWLYDRIDYERIRPTGQSPFRLERIERLLKRIGSPQERIPCVHIAGTKGKGSTAAMIDSILQAAGIRTGLFTSPHIEQFEERMRVCGHMPKPEQLTRLVAQLSRMLETADAEAGDREPTFFEMTTLLGWMLFEEERVQLAVLETGLGGRLDCTNVCDPLVTVITSIGLDHTHILGNTLQKIAFEKAGILKPGIPVIQGQLPGEADAVVEERARKLGCPRLVCGRDFAWHQSASSTSGRARQRHQNLMILTPGRSYDRLSIPLLGVHQAHNASLAVMACEILRDGNWPQIDDSAIAHGLQQTHWPLRFEIFDGEPTIVLDAAHNPDSMRAVCQVLEGSEWKNRKRVLIFAASADKDVRSMMSIIVPHFDEVVLTRFLGNPRSVPVAQLQEMAADILKDSESAPVIYGEESPKEALSQARRLAGAKDLICITGSIFLAAEVRGLLKEQMP